MNRAVITFLITCLFSTGIVSGQIDSLQIQKKQKSFLKQNVIPISLITVGSLISTSKFEKDLQNNIRDLIGNRFNTGIDNYTRYVPLAELMIADVAGVKAKNHWFDQAKNWTIS